MTLVLSAIKAATGGPSCNGGFSGQEQVSMAAAIKINRIGFALRDFLCAEFIIRIFFK